MDSEKLSQRWFVAAITYLVIGLGLGVYMGASGKHVLYTVHSHISLLGWTSMGLTGLLYRSFPSAAQTHLAAWHFWLYQLGVPAMLLAIVALRSGVEGAGVVVGAASVVVFVSVLLFWWAIFSAWNRETARRSVAPDGTGKLAVRDARVRSWPRLRETSACR